MMGWGAVLMNTRVGPGKADAHNPEAWCAWIHDAMIYSGLDMTVTSMSLTRAMCHRSWEGYLGGAMPALLNLLEHLLLREADDSEDDEYCLACNLELFESSLVGALLGAGIKVVKVDI